MFGETESWLVADILADTRARAPAFGLRSPLQLPFPCAAKTGTSSNFRDNWCLGFTRDYTVGVWAGNFDNTPMRGLSGVAGAGPVFQQTMLALHENHDAAWLDRPDELVRVRIDPRNGLTVGEEAAHSVREWVRRGHEPAVARADGYDEEGRWRLDSTYAEWLESDQNRRRDEFAPDLAAASEAPLRILAPRSGTVYLLDPELPNGGRLHLASNLPGSVEWSCRTLELIPGDPEPTVILQAGRHRLIARDTRNDRSHEVEIVVEEW
jgi:penicillin-binding protein 1C